MNIVAIMVGVPASGKSTLRNYLFPSGKIVCPDDYIGYTKDNPWSFAKACMAWKRADELYIKYLKEKNKTIVFDATMLSEKRRKKYIKLAKDNDYVCLAIYCKTSIDVCRQRNAARSLYRMVPEQTVENMLSKLTAPQIEEGFDAVVVFDNSKNSLKFNSKIYKQSEFSFIKLPKKY